MPSIINSASTPIDVDALPRLQSDAAWIYGKIWRNRVPCAQLQEVNDFPQFSSTRNTGELQHCTTLPATVLNQESLAALRTIPNLQSYTATFNKFKNTNNNLGLWINIGSTFVPFRVSNEIDFVFLKEVVQSGCLIEHLHRARRWMRNSVSALNPSFFEWYQQQMEIIRIDDPLFSVGLEPVSFASLLPLAGQEWMTSTILEAIMSDFEARYGFYNSNTNLFISPNRLSDWMREHPKLGNTTFYNWNVDGLRSGRYDAVYSIVYLDSHWGVIKLDMVSCTVYIGDGMRFSDNRYSTAVHVLKAWVSSGVSSLQSKKWTRMDIQRLHQPRQSDSSSCGVIAAHMIENDITGQEFITTWTEKVNVKHRAKYLARLMGFDKVKK